MRSILTLFLPLYLLFLQYGLSTTLEDNNWKTEQVITCYIRTWAVYRETFPFTLKDITGAPLNNCTHLIYLYAGLADTADDLKSRIPHIDLQENGGHGFYMGMTALKKTHPDLKVLLGLGGSADPASSYSRLAKSPSKRRNFATNVVQYLRRFNFDGLDINWFQLGRSSSLPEDKENFPKLLEEVKKKFDGEGLLLAVVLGGEKSVASLGYDLPSIARHVDWINLNGFNYHTPWDGQFGVHAPLRSSDNNDVVESVERFLGNGVPASKLVLRVAINGYGYKDVDTTTMKASGGMNGLYTVEDRGFLSYYEVCEFLEEDEWTRVWDNLSSTPYAKNTGAKLQISYDDPSSLVIKGKYVAEKGLLGLAVVSLDMDDFKGVARCSEKLKGPYPLLRAMVESTKPGNVTKSSFSSSSKSSSINVTVITEDF